MTLQMSYQEKYEQGLEQGATRGRMQVLVHLIAKKRNKNQSVPEIAEELKNEVLIR